MNNKDNVQTTHGVSLEDIAAGVAVVDARIEAVLAGVMAQRRSVEVAFAYLAGLSGQVKANCWALAEAAGHTGWTRMQALLGRYVWDFTAVRAQLAPLAAGWLSCPDDDLIGAGLAIDETAALKSGDDTFAVAPQYAGCTGKVENCVTTVVSSYVTTLGSCWVDFDVFLPERRASDRAFAVKCGVPDEVTHVTKPDLAAEQVRRLVATGVPINWIAADEVYGRSGRLRGVCERLGLAYVFAVPSDHLLTTGARTSMTATECVETAVFERRSCGEGSKGPRYFDWAMIGTVSANHFLLIRRLISRPDQLAYFLCYVPDPAKATITYLITIAGRRWPVEETFKTAKDVLGWDQSQARTYTAVNRHTTLAALAQLRHVCALVATTALSATAMPPDPHPHPQPQPQPSSDTLEPATTLTPLVVHRSPVAHENPFPPIDPADLLIPLGDSPTPATAHAARPETIGYIKLSIAEHRRLHQLALAKAAGLLTPAAEAFHLHWSRLRRRHQGISRWFHFRHRIHLATTTG